MTDGNRETDRPTTMNLTFPYKPKPWIKRQRFLNIYHRNGRLSITESFLPNADAFEKVRSALAARNKSGG